MSRLSANRPVGSGCKHHHGIPIADAWEPHEGEHPGRHKRWFLDCDIRPAIPAQEVQA